MDKNTVLLSVDDYNKLRDFKKKITDGKILVDYQFLGGVYRNEVRYYTDDKVIEELHLRNKSLKEEIKYLQNRINDLQNPKPKETTIDEIKKMSVWQFLKWKKG
jgi:hypothetical protein